MITVRYILQSYREETCVSTYVRRRKRKENWIRLILDSIQMMFFIIMPGTCMITSRLHIDTVHVDRSSLDVITILIKISSPEVFTRAWMATSSQTQQHITLEVLITRSAYREHVFKWYICKQLYALCPKSSSLCERDWAFLQKH